MSLADRSRRDRVVLPVVTSEEPTVHRTPRFTGHDLFPRNSDGRG